MVFKRKFRRRWCSVTRRSRRPPSTSSHGRPSGSASTSSTRATPSTAQSCKEDSSQAIIAIILVTVHIFYNQVSCFVHFTLENLFSNVNFCINEVFKGFLDARSHLEEIGIERSVHPLRSSRSVNPILTNGTSFSFLFFNHLTPR